MQITSSSRFKRSFKKLSRLLQIDFEKRIILFIKDPFHPTLRTHKLSGNLDEYYSFYLRDGFRVLFVFETKNVALLVNVGSHDDYKKWGRD